MKLIKETRKKLQDRTIAVATGIPLETVISHTTGRRKKKNPVLETYFSEVIENAKKQISE